MNSNRKVWGVVFIVFGVLVLSGAALQYFRPVQLITAKTAEVLNKFGNNLPNFDFDGKNNITEQGSQTFDPSQHQKLVLSNKAGKIHITADPDAKQVKVNYEKAIALNLNNDEAHKRLQNVQVKLAPSGDEEHVDVVYNDNMGFFQNTYVNFDIVVPPNMQIDVQSNAGEVVTSGLESRVTVHLNAGKIQVDGFKDTVDVHTNAGEVVVSGGKDIHRIDAETNAGAVNVSLPEAANLGIDAITNVGSISSDFPMTITKHLPGSSLHDSLGTGNNGLVTLRTNTGAISIYKQQ